MGSLLDTQVVFLRFDFFDVSEAGGLGALINPILVVAGGQLGVCVRPGMGRLHRFRV